MLKCFCTAAFAILAYIYCLWYNEEFGYQKAKSRIHNSVQVGSNSITYSFARRCLHVHDLLEPSPSSHAEACARNNASL